MLFRSLMAVAVAAAFSFGTVAAAQAAPDNGTGGKSTNWAGYAVQAKPGQTFDSVTASWVEPAMAVACGSPGTNPSLVTFSAGLDGFGNGTQEHAGTAMQCAGRPGTAPAFKETAYYETCVGLHCTTVRLFGAFPLQAGDLITVEVTFADGAYTFTLQNDRTDQTFTATLADNGGTRTSAEAVVDVPVPAGTAPLLNFGKVTFEHFKAHADASGDENADSEGDDEDGHSKPVAITMSGPKGDVRAQPDARHGNHFSVDWKASL